MVLGEGQPASRVKKTSATHPEAAPSMNGPSSGQMRSPSTTRRRSAKRAKPHMETPYSATAKRQKSAGPVSACHIPAPPASVRTQQPREADSLGSSGTLLHHH